MKYQLYLTNKIPFHGEPIQDLLFNFIEITNEWLDKTEGEFIIDTFIQFEM